jgi:hypothetical protein
VEFGGTSEIRQRRETQRIFLFGILKYGKLLPLLVAGAGFEHLNQRPLGYEGKFCRNLKQGAPTNPNQT